jgi:asparagine synthase (glutamine-hydrolysing)
MCGITGFYKESKGSRRELLLQMSNIIQSRGPDHYGEFISENRRLYLAHQRLSILDLSNAGAQPMESASKRFIIVFNGEIYNFRELKEELLDSGMENNLRGNSDTEILLESISYWGVEATLSKINGMFAFALYDLERDKIVFARDRFGEKPLYIYSDHHSFAFASQLKPIECFTNNLTINQAALGAQLSYSYIPAPHSIYNEVFKLLPGHFLEIDLTNIHKINYSSSRPYWRMEDLVKKSLGNKRQFDDASQVKNETKKILKKSVKQRMVSDVPLGSFLSGGIDSTCITALMQEQSDQKVKTFSIGFNDDNYNEAQHAKKVAKYLGTDHHEMYIDADDMLDLVPKLSDIYDEPFSDSSQLPTLMVSKLAKSQVTVALTGDSGDEVFCGYTRYSVGADLYDRFKSTPVSPRYAIGTAAQLLSPSSYSYTLSIISKVIPRLRKYKRFGDNVHKIARVIDFKDEADLYRKLISTSSESYLTNEIQDIVTDIMEAFGCSDLHISERMMWQDSVGYMRNDILTKVDRASMAVSLETRIPFLDNKVVEHAWSLPLANKQFNGLSKSPLRDIVSDYVPDNIMNRPKAGFGIPIDSLLRNQLREWAEGLLSESALSKTGFIDVRKVRNVWRAHLSGKVNEQYSLWNILMFQQWNLNR